MEMHFVHTVMDPSKYAEPKVLFQFHVYHLGSQGFSKPNIVCVRVCACVRMCVYSSLTLTRERVDPLIFSRNEASSHSITLQLSSTVLQQHLTAQYIEENYHTYRTQHCSQPVPSPDPGRDA